MANNLIFTANDINSLQDRVGIVEQRFDIKNAKHNNKGTVTDYTTAPNTSNASLKIYSAALSIDIPQNVNKQDVKLLGDGDGGIFTYKGLTFSTPPAVTLSINAQGGYWVTTNNITAAGTEIYFHARAAAQAKKSIFPKKISLSIIAIGY
jgi:hypothetical protein